MSSIPSYTFSKNRKIKHQTMDTITKTLSLRNEIIKKCT